MFSLLQTQQFIIYIVKYFTLFFNYYLLLSSLVVKNIYNKKKAKYC